MKKFISTLLFLSTAQILLAQETNPWIVLQDQVEAFNNRDVEALINNVTEDFKWFYITTDSLILEVSGKESFKSGMEGYFKSFSYVETSISSYVINGNRISFEEQVTYTNSKGDTLNASSLGIYEIKQGLITRAWYFSD